MRLSGNRLKMSDGSIHQFKDAKSLANFERVANAVKHNPELKEKLKARKKRKY